jgi:Sigma-70 region 2
MTEEDFDQLRPSAFAIAYRMLGSVSEAEDVLQEVFLRLHRARGRRADRVAARLPVDGGLEAFRWPTWARCCASGARFFSSGLEPDRDHCDPRAREPVAEASTVRPPAPASDEEQLRDDGASSLLASRVSGCERGLTQR